MLFLDKQSKPDSERKKEKERECGVSLAEIYEKKEEEQSNDKKAHCKANNGPQCEYNQFCTIEETFM